MAYKDEPIETHRALKFYKGAHYEECRRQFQKLLVELMVKDLLPCEINIQVMFVGRRCP